MIKYTKFRSTAAYLGVARLVGEIDLLLTNEEREEEGGGQEENDEQSLFLWIGAASI